jgi:DNA-binding Xre family transcriptional regulator
VIGIDLMEYKPKTKYKIFETADYKDMMKNDLVEIAKISTALMSNLGRNGNITIKVLAKYIMCCNAKSKY